MALTDEDKTWLLEVFTTAITTAKDEAIAVSRQVETNLLTEFHKWAQTYEIRARGTSAAVNLFDERLGAMEERISDLERRNPPRV